MAVDRLEFGQPLEITQLSVATRKLLRNWVASTSRNGELSAFSPKNRGSDRIGLVQFRLVLAPGVRGQWFG